MPEVIRQAAVYGYRMAVRSDLLETSLFRVLVFLCSFGLLI